METIMEFVTKYMFFILLAIVIIILLVNKVINKKKLEEELEPYFKFLMEEDYVFLLQSKYGKGSKEDIKAMYNKRIKSGLAGFLMTFIIMSVAYQGSFFITLLLSFIIAYVMFKSQYQSLKKFYKKYLYKINLMLPYYLKSLEILVQHYTVPVALSKSIKDAPPIFKEGLKKLIEKIEKGDSSVEPYMDFAKEYPVRDSMRMMRLLYRLSLGTQESKQKQLLMFSNNVSILQEKAREQRYKNRLEAMEKRTLIMLTGTGGGILLLLMFAIFSMMSNAMF